jgi:hypothetical protein
MPREVIIEGTTFIVNSFSSEDAKESAEDILRRVIIKNAETEFINKPFVINSKTAEPFEMT